MRIFGSDRLSGLMKRLGMEEGVPIEHRWVTNSIERAQSAGRGPQLRHPQAPPRVRRRHEQAARGDLPAPQGDPHRQARRTTTSWPSPRTSPRTTSTATAPPPRTRPSGTGTPSRSSSSRRSASGRPRRASRRTTRTPSSRTSSGRPCARRTRRRRSPSAPDVLRDFEKFFMLQTVDTLWKDHLLALDHLKEGIGLRGYGQRDPLVEYKKESFQLFEAMKEGDRGADPPVPLPLRGRPGAGRARARRATRGRRRRRAPTPAPRRGSAASRRAAAELEKQARQQGTGPAAARAPSTRRPAAISRSSTVKAAGPKVGRNDPCPCGSGKKYKKCHGAPAAGRVRPERPAPEAGRPPPVV